MLAGYTAGAILSFLVDLIFFFGQGHAVHVTPLAPVRGGVGVLGERGVVLPSQFVDEFG